MPNRTASLLYISGTVELESPNFTSISRPAWPTLEPDMMSLSTSGWKLQRKNCRKCRLRISPPPEGDILQVEFLKNCLSEDHQISHGCLGPLVPETCRIWRHSLLPVSCEMQLNTGQKWCVKQVRPDRVKYCIKVVWLVMALAFVRRPTAVH